MSVNISEAHLENLRMRFGTLRGMQERVPDVSIVIPVNAQEDLETVLHVLEDLATCSGGSTAEVILVVNNFAPDAPPAEIDLYRKMNITVLALPNVRRAGEAPGFSARIPGAQTAHCENIVSFDADCRILDATALIDWYARQLRGGAAAAYTHVGYYALKKGGWIKLRMLIHHSARFVKRNVLGIPTIRGSNYGVKRTLLLKLYSDGVLADDINVGPGIKACKSGRIAYSGSSRLHVLTSGRRFNNSGGKRLLRYFRYRLRYNLRVLPVRPDAAHHTGRTVSPSQVRLHTGVASGDQVKNESK